MYVNMYTIYFNISAVSVFCVLSAFSLLFFQLTLSKSTEKNLKFSLFFLFLFLCLPLTQSLSR